ncbi:MAG: glycosyltransferase family 2 protein [Solobacterium sp.]|nr:glycosyltransferase family 2 protein [Solobacterium sp.]
MMPPIISVIIPVYNAEKYLDKCLSSVCAQTFQALDIIVIDDGSTDSSGKIADTFAQRDPRIRVFHTENRGHYLARGTAIAEAHKAGSSYIGFVDSDDTIVPEMYEVMYQRAVDTGADIVECGFFQDYPDHTTVWRPAEGVRDTTAALCELFRGRSRDFFWNKLWRISCFDGFSFPDAQAYADISVSYRIYSKARIFAGIVQPLYHYRQVSDSIVHKNDMRLLRLWQYNREKYMYILTEMRSRIGPDVYAEIENSQLSRCVYAIGKNWVWWLNHTPQEQELYRDELYAMSSFICTYTPVFGRSGWSFAFRLTCLLARFPNRVSLRISYLLEKVLLAFRKRRYY